MFYHRKKCYFGHSMGKQSNEKQETQTERYGRETTIVCLLALRSMHDSPCPESQGLTSQNCIPQLPVPLVSSAVGFSQWMCSRLDGSRLDGRRIFLLRFLQFRGVSTWLHLPEVPCFCRVDLPWFQTASAFAFW